MTQNLPVLDLLVIVLYLAGMIGMGFYFSHRSRSTENYFVGGRQIPWWAVGLSIFGTQLSAITYIAIPGRAYETDWSWLIYNLGVALIGAIVIYLFLPLYRAKQITSIYEYLETRFSPEIRAYGALAYVFMQVGRVAIILYLPALVLHEVTGYSVESTILAMGLAVTVYTVVGGIEAVIWTDVVQVFILLAGALATLALIVLSVDGGFSTIAQTGEQYAKFNMVHWDASNSEDLIGYLILGGLFANIVPYATDQTVVQRYFTTKTERQARNSIWLSTLFTIPVSLLFFFLGTALFTYYHIYPERIPATIHWDRIYPYFIIHELPAGATGLVIAAIFAAAMSSLSSCLNSISTVGITDFYKRFMQPEADDRRCLQLAKGITIGSGLFSTLLAIGVARLLLRNPDQQGAWDFFVAVQGLLGGGLAGVFCAGVFSKRTNSAGVTAGLVISAAVLSVMKYEWKCHTQTLAAIGILTAWIVSYAFSYLTSPSMKSEKR